MHLFELSITCADPDGVGAGGPDHYPLKNYRTIGFLSNTGPDPLNIRIASKPALNVGPSSVCQRPAYGGICFLSPLIT